ncbi:hypothetical protein QSV08_09545 [Maribacter sp. BPC-D8]|uniref:hypothetical protein n=1 Tax=Maribacter sp. BPC-D8 TaxID=3053613 RepID=UPI002B46C48C|nr:hypothetical protein [Maribacter sp. BPC-D8]WRI31478.1 hypothetical protein QSV08_09545 [Maribacter sp. BPC-D8]
MNIPQSELKKTFLNSYTNFSELENALLAIREMNDNGIGISVIGNANDIDVAHQSALHKNDIQKLLKKIVGEETEFDSFYNRELGHLFVSGFLVSTFLNPVGKSNIGILSGGPYGVLRGFGISEQHAAESVKNLSNGDYLLVIRGNNSAVEKIASILVD